MTTPHAPFRYDIVGSFLRPDALKKARLASSLHQITAQELTAAEDAAILDLIAKQKAAGLPVITDGEFRRSWWHLDFMWGLGGIEKANTAKGLQFHGERTKAETAVITGPITGAGHPFVEHFKFVKAQEAGGVVAKQTIPAPAQLLVQLRLPEYLAQNRQHYPSDDALLADIGAAYQTVIRELYDAGCRNLQLDDCTWGLYVDKSFWPMFDLDEEKVRTIAKEQIALNNLALKGKPDDLTVTTHVCRGNFHSTYASSGAYDPIAPYLFRDEAVSAFYLEYDDARSGGFEPLRYVAPDKAVVLGLITTKSPQLEEKAAIIQRIREAAQFVPLDRLYLSPQCGFASTEEGNRLTEADQWAKLALVRDIAREVWGEHP